MRPATAKLRIVSLAAALLASPAAAETECEGVNLLDQLAAQEPTRYAEIRAEADRLPNGTGVFWRIATNGAPPSWLFGTMHVADARVVTLPAPVAEALAGASTLAVEIADALDGSAFARLAAEHPELILAPEGGALSEVLSQATVTAISEALEARGLSFAAFERLQPWVAAAAFSISACEYALQIGGNPTLDESLTRAAMGEGLQLVGLESLVSQLQAVSSLGRQVFLNSLESYARLYSDGSLDALAGTFVELYLDEDIGAMLPTTIAFVTDEAATRNDQAEFERQLIEMRNRNMLDAARPLLEAGGVFIAVGAMHLPGETGLIEGLREAGYTVTRVPLTQ